MIQPTKAEIQQNEERKIVKSTQAQEQTQVWVKPRFILFLREEEPVFRKSRECDKNKPRKSRW